MAEKQEEDRTGRIEACKTFVEQTKLLVSLASAFVIAPPCYIELYQDWPGLENLYS